MANAAESVTSRNKKTTIATLTADQQFEVYTALSARIEHLQAVLADDVDPYTEWYIQHKLELTRQARDAFAQVRA